MTLYCSVCFFIEGRGDTEAEIVKAGYSLCEDHAWVDGQTSHALAINEANRAADNETSEHGEST